MNAEGYSAAIFSKRIVASTVGTTGSNAYGDGVLRVVGKTTSVMYID